MAELAQFFRPARCTQSECKATDEKPTSCNYQIHFYWGCSGDHAIINSDGPTTTTLTVSDGAFQQCGTGGPSARSASLRIGLGNGAPGKAAPNLTYDQMQPGAGAYLPSALQFPYAPPTGNNLSYPLSVYDPSEKPE